MKKIMISFVVVIAMLTALLQSGAFSVDAHAESLGLRSYNGWFSNAKAVNKSQIRKVCNLAKSQTDSKVGQRVDDILFKATYKPSDIGGKDWAKDNRGSGIKSVYDPGLGTTVKWNSSAWGCYSYAMYVSKYVRGSTGSIISTDKGVVPSVSKVKWLLQTYADPGEHIRYYYKTPSGSKTVHSVAYLAGDSEGFYFASESGNYLKITIHYCKFTTLQKMLRVKSGQGSLLLYDTNGGKDKKGATASVKNHSVKNNANSSVSSQSVSGPKPRYTPDTSAYKVSYSRVLKKTSGPMKGDDVKYMQACLYYLGYDIDVDGVYGSGTAATVKQFQSNNSMSADGVIGPSTWPAIEKAVKDNPATASLTIKTQPKSVTVAPGGTVKCSVSASGSKLSYQWYYKKSGESGWTKWKGHTSSSFSETADSTWNGMAVYCKVTDGSGKSVNSKNAVVTVSKEFKITDQPKNTTVNLGESVSVSVKAQGTGLSYQWYYKKAGSSSWSKWASRTHASEAFTPDESWNGAQLYCKVKDSSGKTLDSNAAVIKVNSELKITEQPKNTTVNLGEDASVWVKVQGKGLSYQWYYRRTDEPAWSKWVGRTNAKETVTPNLSWDGIQVYCKVKDSSGKICNSSFAVIKVNPVLCITEQPRSRTVVLGDALTVSVKAEGKGLRYQWYYRKVGNSSWTEWNGRVNASETVVPNETWNGMQLYCRVKDSSGKTVSSSVAYIRVCPELDSDNSPRG